MDENVESASKLRCNRCGEWKEKSAFHRVKRSTRGFEYSCRDCISIIHTRLRQERKNQGLCVRCGRQKQKSDLLACFSCAERARNERKRFDKKVKLEVFNAYGAMVCACCGERRVEFLTIDHIEGCGREHRKTLRFSGSQFYRWLRKNNYPQGFQILCYNCNCAKGHSRYCPHEWEKLYPKIYSKDDIDLSQWNMDLPVDKRPIFYGKTSVDLTQWKEAVAL